MSRLALIGVMGAAVIIVAASLIYSISQQEGDDSGESDAFPTADGASSASSSTGVVPSDNGAGNVNSAAGLSGGDSSVNQIKSPNHDALSGSPSFDVVRVNPNGDAVIAGRATAGYEVLLLDDGKVIGRAKADDRGEWVMLPNSSIAPGEHKFTLQAQPEIGTRQSSERMVIVVVPAPAKDIAGNAVATPAGVLALSVPQKGDAPTEILNMPIARTSLDRQAWNQELTLDVIDFDKNGTLAFAGRALMGLKIALYLDDKLIGSVIADPQGRWRFRPKIILSVGRHDVRIDQLDANEKVTMRIAQEIEQPDLALLVPHDTHIVIQSGNSLWRLARQAYGDGQRYSVIYEANKDQLRDPDLIYPGQILSLP